MTDQSTRWPSRIALDLLRGLAAVAVMLAHTRGASFVAYGSLPSSNHSAAVAIFFAVTRLGTEPVLIFFVLSGFLVGGQIIRRLQQGRFRLGDYAIARATRIFMPLAPSILLTLGVIALAHEPIDLSQALANLVGLNGVLAPTLAHNAPLWTLAFEIWFYVAGGALACLLARKAPAGKFAAAVVLAAALLVFAVLGERYLLYWWLGALAILLVDMPGNFWLFAVGVGMAIAGAIFDQLGQGGISVATVHLVSQQTAAMMLAAGIAFSIPYLCSDIVQKKLFKLRHAASALAALSYTLYLVHYPVNSLLNHIFPRAGRIDAAALILFGLRILICVAAAGLWWSMFEKHTQKVRDVVAKFQDPDWRSGAATRAASLTLRLLRFGRAG